MIAVHRDAIPLITNHFFHSLRSHILMFFKVLLWCCLQQLYRDCNARLKKTGLRDIIECVYELGMNIFILHCKINIKLVWQEKSPLTRFSYYTTFYKFFDDEVTVPSLQIWKIYTSGIRVGKMIQEKKCIISIRDC